LDSIIVLLKDTPIPTILVVSGVVFLFLALAGQIAGKLEVPPARQKWAAATGAIFLGVGLLLYLAPSLPRGAQAEISSNPIRATATPPGAGQVPAAGQAQIDPQAVVESGAASPAISEAASAPVAEGSDECLNALFSGVAPDRVVRVESGTVERDLLTAQQPRSTDPAGIVLLELGQPVVALSYYFFEDDELFKIGSLVDGACQPLEYANASRGGDKNVLQNWDTLEVIIGANVYALRFSYYGGVVAVGTSKFPQ
jgi:hypothetical protein